MAILGNDFTQEFASVKPEDFTPVPAGEYVMQVTKTELKQTSTGGLCIKVQFDIIGPAYQGRKLFANFNIRNSSAEAERIGRQQLKALVIAGRVQEPLQDSDQLLGATVKASVTIRKATDEYPASNDVKNYKAVEGAMPSGVPAGDAVIPPAGGGFSQAFSQPAQARTPDFKW